MVMSNVQVPLKSHTHSYVNFQSNIISCSHAHIGPKILQVLAPLGKFVFTHLTLPSTYHGYFTYPFVQNLFGPIKNDLYLAVQRRTLLPPLSNRKFGRMCVDLAALTWGKKTAMG